MGIRTSGHRRRGRLHAAVLLTGLVAASCTRLDVDLLVLADDPMQGRNNNTAGSVLAQRHLILSLKEFAVGLDASKTGDDAFRQPFDSGTNIVGLIPGGELADEYVIVGGHYDHLGSSCRTADPADTICNGATDNGAGTAAVLEIGRQIADAPGPPRRSVILALWDREEDGLLGSRHYVEHPLVPLAQTVAYVNFDIQGANLLPSLRTTSFAVGAESGGAALQSIVTDAIEPSTLDTHLLSSIFGQGRSDYVNFTGVGVPTVFFSDSTGPCYHTAQDDARAVDFGKLHLQAEIGERVTRTLAQMDGRPTFSGTNPPATYEDAVALRDVVSTAIVDLGRFDATQQQRLLQFGIDLDTIVTAGPAAFDTDDATTLLLGAAAAVDILTTGACDAFTGP